MVTWLQEPYPVRCVPTGRQVSGGAQSGSKGEGPSLSGGGAHQTLFHFPERGLRESGTAVWAHYPRADSGLLGRCDTDVTVTARGTEFDWMRRNLLWCILGTQSRARGRARSVQAPPARSLAPRAPLYAFLEGRGGALPHLHLHKHYHSSPIKTVGILLTHPPFHSLTGRPRHREHPGQAWPRPRAALGTPGERRTPARVRPHVHHARGPKGPGSTIRIRARSHPTTASQPWDHTGQARPVMPKAQPTPLPKFTHRDGGGKPFARPRHWPAKNRPTTHSPNPGGSRQSQRAAATGV